MGHSAALEPIKYVAERERRSAGVVRDLLNNDVQCDWVQMELIDQKVVRVPRLDIPFLKFLSGKVTKVAGDDHLSVRTDRGCNDVSIIWVRQRDRLD